MAPVYDTDIAAERYASSEWQHYELWEKVEQRLRRRRWAWIAVTVLVFLLLSSVPVIMEREPKWASLGAVRRLAAEVSWIKRHAGAEQQAYRIRFEPDSLNYVIERGPHCSQDQWKPVRADRLMSDQSGRFRLVDSATGQAAGIPGLVQTFCYSPLSGSNLILEGQSLAGLAVASAKDLAERRLDRFAVLLLKGPSAEISFE